MKLFLGFAFAMLTLSTAAYAEDSNRCEQISDSAWNCPITKKSPPITCHIYGNDQICTAPINEKNKPVNCGFNRAGKYICW